MITQDKCNFRVLESYFFIYFFGLVESMKEKNTKYKK